MESIYSPEKQSLVLGGGCFWCLEAVYQSWDGVLSVTPGYGGGTLARPTYEQVCGGETGHGEVVQVVFDPARLPLDLVLDIFFVAHDPTTLNRQGYDLGSQYRSLILYGDRAQEEAARAAIARHQPDWPDPIVTQVGPLDRFWPAEADHWDYYRRHGGAPYCQGVIGPKLAGLRAAFAGHPRLLPEGDGDD